MGGWVVFAYPYKKALSLCVNVYVHVCTCLGVCVYMCARVLSM